MGKKKKFKEEEEIGKDYQYLVTWQITLDYKDNKTLVTIKCKKHNCEF